MMSNQVGDSRQPVASDVPPFAMRLLQAHADHEDAEQAEGNAGFTSRFLGVFCVLCGEGFYFPPTAFRHLP